MNQPLVSVVVITYNSAQYVLETLESAKAQTYQNIELIISDDGSTDKTIEICENWLAENKERFVHSQIITVEKNTGIPANCNRGVKASKGECIKLIAGDDILLGDCIEIMYHYCIDNDMDMATSPVLYIDENGQNIDTDFDNLKDIQNFFKKNSKQRLKSFLRHPIFLYSPAFFFLRTVYDKVDGFDERIKLLEDQPFFIKCFLQNFNFGLCQNVTVKYRKHNISTLADTNFSENLFQSFLLYRKPNLKDGLLNNIFAILEELRFNSLKSKNIFLSRILSKIYFSLFKKFN